MKDIDPTVKIITSNNITINYLDKFPSDADSYINTFTNIVKRSRTFRVYISHQIELAKSLFDLKNENKSTMMNIFDNWIKNNTSISHNKFKSHKEDSLGFFININPKVMPYEKIYAIAFKND